jgi:hypothetical protein
VEQVEFFAAYDDGSGWSWHRLGADTDSSDGWRWNWNVSGLSAQSDAAVFVYVWDRAHNGQGAAVSGMIINASSPAGRVLLPLLERGQTSTPTPTTQTFYSLANDGELGLLECTDWLSCHNGNSGNFLLTTFPDATVSSSKDANTYSIKRIFLFFDTSSLPAGAEITSAVLDVYAGQYQHGNTGARLVRSRANAPLSASDFAQVDFSLGILTTPQPNQWVTFSLPARWLTLDGMTRLALVHQLDYSNQTPESPNDLIFALNENGAYAPRLTVTYLKP